MTTTTSTAPKRWGARLTAGLGVAVLGVAALGAPAFATPAFGNIDAKASGSITLHKHENQPNSPVAGDPDAPGSTLPNPIAGVVFTAYKLTDFDVQNSANWNTLAAGSVPANACDAPALSGWTLGSAIPFPATNSTGVTTLDLSNAAPTDVNAKLGAYLICETGGTAGIEQKAAPFVVTVPYPDTARTGATNGWLYDVHAYPKNTRSTTITKAAKPQTSPNYGLGSVAEFTTTTSVPRIPTGDVFTEYSVIDPIDPRLGAVGTGQNEFVKSVEYIPASGGPAQAVPAANYQVFRTANVVTVQFNATGLAWLKTNASGGQILVTFHGTVNSLTTDPIGGWTATSGQIVNTAGVLVKHAPSTNPPVTPPVPPTYPPTPPTTPPTPPAEPPVTPSNETHTNWGDLKIFKQDAQESGGTPKGLQGAVFSVYDADPAYPAAGDTCADSTRVAGPLTVQVPNPAYDPQNPTAAPATIPATQFTSGATGNITIPGLYISVDNLPTMGSTERCYFIEEITAPAGYVLPANPVTSVTVKTGVTSTVDITVNNTKQLIPGLPLTGSQAQVIMMVLGGALVAIGGGAALVASRRKRAEAAA